VIPEPQIRDEVAVVPGTDGQKMSKSYGNTIEIFGDEKAIQKKIMSIKMDSRTPTEPKPDAEKNLAVQLLKLVEIKSFADAVEDKLRNGQIGYGDLKKQLFKSYWDYFANARRKRAELAANLDYVNQVLADGATKARILAQQVLKRARKNCGLE
jgi:tryptophanyl-tRNA synthetase